MRKIEIKHTTTTAVRACYAGEKVARPRKAGVVCGNCSRWAKA